MDRLAIQETTFFFDCRENLIMVWVIDLSLIHISKIEEAYRVFENRLDGVIKVAIAGK